VVGETYEAQAVSLCGKTESPSNDFESIIGHSTSIVDTRFCIHPIGIYVAYVGYWAAYVAYVAYVGNGSMFGAYVSLRRP
jgi:hypothetical protein